MLARVGAVLNGQSRDVDVVARIGGEEFAVLLPNTDGGAADDFTQRIRRALAVADASGLPIVRLSAGVASATAPDDIGPLMQRADTALYAAKRAGRDRTVVSGGRGGRARLGAACERRVSLAGRRDAATAGCRRAARPTPRRQLDEHLGVEVADGGGRAALIAIASSRQACATGATRAVGPQPSRHAARRRGRAPGPA